MQNNCQNLNRHSVRLSGYDYSQPGGYCLTMLTFKRACIFGKVTDGVMVQNEIGKIVENTWWEIPDHFPTVELGAFMVMPNHLHGILVISNLEGKVKKGTTSVGGMTVGATNVGATHESPLHGDFSPNAEITQRKTIEGRPAKTMLRPHGPAEMSIGGIIGLFKAAVSKKVHAQYQSNKIQIWQRNYYDHVFRDETDHERIFEYIYFNPSRWIINDQDTSGMIWLSEKHSRGVP
ncbi:MAG: hypothetical protein WA110_09275 [Anaerolineaceae bacterium]